MAPRLLVAGAEYVLEQAEEEAGSRLGSDDKSAIDGGGGAGLEESTMQVSVNVSHQKCIINPAFGTRRTEIMTAVFCSFSATPAICLVSDE